jgi:hypothetical protein
VQASTSKRSYVASSSSCAETSFPYPALQRSRLERQAHQRRRATRFGEHMKSRDRFCAISQRCDRSPHVASASRRGEHGSRDSPHRHAPRNRVRPSERLATLRHCWRPHRKTPLDEAPPAARGSISKIGVAVGSRLRRREQVHVPRKQIRNCLVQPRDSQLVSDPAFGFSPHAPSSQTSGAITQ